MIDPYPLQPEIGKEDERARWKNNKVRQHKSRKVLQHCRCALCDPTGVLLMQTKEHQKTYEKRSLLAKPIKL
jgi:hypothetical protein